MKSNQLSLFTVKKFKKRKVARPISTKEFLHVTFKSRLPVLRTHHALIFCIVQEAQKRYRFELKAFALMPNHLHFAIRVHGREDFANAMRFISSKIAMGIGRGKLWKERVWSRIVKRGRDLLNVIRYINANPVVANIFSEIDAQIEFRNGLFIRSEFGLRENSS